MRSERKEGRITATDCILVLLILLSAIGIGFRAWQRRHPPVYGKATDVGMLWQDVDRRTVACLAVGETLYTEAGAEFGTVTAVETLPVVRELRTPEGVVRGEVPDDPRCNASVTVSVRLEFRQGLPMRENGQPLPVGNAYVLFGARTRVVLAVRWVEKEQY